MFSASAGIGFTSFFPPTVTVRLISSANAVSTLPGCRTWQPAHTITAETAMPIVHLRSCNPPQAIAYSTTIVIFNVAVIGAAEVIADRRIGAGRIRCDRDIAGLSCFHLAIDLQLTHEEAVREVFTVQPQGHRLALLQRDLFRRKPKPLR